MLKMRILKIMEVQEVNMEVQEESVHAGFCFGPLARFVKKNYMQLCSLSVATTN